MNIVIIIASIVIALLGYPIGIWIAKLTKEELRQGRRWFKLITIVCFLGIILSLFFAVNETLLFLTCAFLFILLFTLACLIKSKQKTKKARKTKK